MGAVPRQVTLAMARLVAEAHARTGLAEFNELQRASHEAKQKAQKPSFSELVGHAAPAATYLALALELHLKVLHFQHFQTYPQTHKLLDICSAFPSDTIAVVSKAYEEFYSRPTPFEVEHCAFAAAGSDASYGPYQIPNVSTFPAAMAHASNAFVVWRYFYERLISPEQIGIHFKALLCLIEAVHSAIAGYKGNASVKIG